MNTSANYKYNWKKYDRKHEQGFSILEVIASVVVLSFGIIAAVRMQVSAVATSRAPVANQEIAAIARRALEEAIPDCREIDGYEACVEIESCSFTGTDLDCSGAGDRHVDRITTIVTSPIDGSDFEMTTFRVN